MAPSHVLTPDAQAILLLCGRFGKHEGGRAKALTLREYGEVADWLISRGLRPADLLRPEGSEALRDFGSRGAVTHERLEALLQRGAAMAMFLESWTSEGGWVLARSDEAYPWRLKRRLRHLAPPILYGVGDTSLLDLGGLSMVGSRDADDAALSFVADFAAKCAREHIQVVSGGARGVDRTAMEAGLAEGATVVGALANGLAQTARRKAYRQAIRAGQLTLVSAYHPDSKFAVWTAMDRNKHIYALSDAALVAHSAVDQGGTWAGATENLEHGWVPLLVRSEEPLPVGNRALLSMGGIGVDRAVLRGSDDLFTWLNRTIPQAQGARVGEVAEPGDGEVARGETVALPGAAPLSVAPPPHRLRTRLPPRIRLKPPLPRSPIGSGRHCPAARASRSTSSSGRRWRRSWSSPAANGTWKRSSPTCGSRRPASGSGTRWIEATPCARSGR